MMNKTAFMGRIARHFFVLAALVGLTFAAGIDWAHAATQQAGGTVPGHLHVLILFLTTIAFVIGVVIRSQKPVRTRSRRNRRR